MPDALRSPHRARAGARPGDRRPARRIAPIKRGRASARLQQTLARRRLANRTSNQPTLQSYQFQDLRLSSPRRESLSNADVLALLFYNCEFCTFSPFKSLTVGMVAHENIRTAAESRRFA